MNKTFAGSVLAVLFLLGRGSVLFAQPVIVNTMLPFPVGTVDSAYSAAASVPPGAGGAGVTWNLSALVPAATGVLSVVAPSSTPYTSTFPTATLCAEVTLISGGTKYLYQRLSSAKWEKLANNYSGVGTGDDYSPNPESYLMFPFSYTNTFTDTFQKTTGGANTVDVTYDGYGTLITPHATYSNVVRIYKYWGPGDYDYNWYVTSPNIGLVAAYHAQTNQYTLIRHAATTALSEVTTQAKAQLYPNPFTGSTTLKIDAPNGLSDASVTITDVMGRVVRSLPVSTPETIISGDGLTAGMYFYAVQNNGKHIVGGRMMVN